MTARLLTDDDVAALRWERYVHRPTAVHLAEIQSPCKIITAGPEPDLDLLPGDYLATSGERLWKLTAEEKAALYERDS